MKGTGTMLLVALLLLAGPALAATPAPLAPPPSLAANDDGATSAAKGPRIEVVIQNGDEQEQVARLRLEDQRTHAVLHDKWIRLPARDVRVLHIPAPEGSYTLNLSQSVYAAGTHNGGGSSHSFDTSGCEGDFRSRFDARGGAFGYYADVARSGCLHPPREMRALIEEARALGHGSGARGVHVALPHDADRGAYRAWGGMHDFPADAGLMRFGWRDARTVPDAAGAPREVREMLTEGPGRSYGWTTRLLASEQVELRDPKQWFHYSGDARFVAAVREAGGPVAEDRQARVTLRHDTTYDPTPRSCLFRAAYQGAEVRPGQSWSAGDVCAAMGLAQWKAGASFETDGRRVVPLYAWEDRAEATLVARLLLADGVAYPVAFDAWRMPRDEPIVRAGYRLVGLEREGAPILRAPPGAPSPPPALAPLDPLRGPALHARGAITFPLDEASDAARADPTLRELQALLARRDAALLGARLTEREEAAAQARTQEWYLVFGARGIDPVGVTCSRAVLAPGTAGPVSCTGGSLPIQWALLDPPRMGRADLPSRAASFDLALERAAAHASRFADGPANFVLYRAWSDARGEARVEVRRDLPLALGFGGARVETPASGVSLGLADGLTLAHSKGVVRASGSAAIPTLQPAAPLGNGAPAPRAPPSALVVG
ncbi:MAG TPA: hypothetical protein VM582_08770, partial [Candidatus Thermoplasmatota archaeon]|nr:hypothetical protein [Candidatus Thermoplasmatota archaeon]